MVLPASVLTSSSRLRGAPDLPMRARPSAWLDAAGELVAIGEATLTARALGVPAGERDVAPDQFVAFGAALLLV
jgi:hypothetical protein